MPNEQVVEQGNHRDDQQDVDDVAEAGDEEAKQPELCRYLWAVIVILIVLWLLGFFVASLGNIVHILLVIAVIALLYNLFVGMRR